MPITPHRLLSGLLLGSMVAATLLAASPTAAAAGGNGVCEAGEFCIYRDASFTGPVMDWARGVDDPRYGDNVWPTTGAVLNDSASSMWNRSTCPVSIWRHGQFTGPGVTLAAGGRVNASATPLGDNMASSHNACP